MGTLWHGGDLCYCWVFDEGVFIEDNNGFEVSIVCHGFQWSLVIFAENLIEFIFLIEKWEPLQVYLCFDQEDSLFHYCH